MTTTTSRPDLGWIERISRLSPSDLPQSGWDGLIAELHEQLLQLDPNYRIDQVKEKLGTLRYYAVFAPEVRERCETYIRAAEAASARTCELCGRPGELRQDRPALQTLCGPCNQVQLERYAARQRGLELERRAHTFALQAERVLREA